MSNFFKSILITLTCGIVLATFVSQKEASTKRESEVTKEVNEFENNIDSGLIIQDGYLEDDEFQLKKDDSNAISSLTSKVGSGISSLVSRILKFFASLINKLLS